MEFDKEQVRHTLSAILHAQGETVAAELLDLARAEIVYASEDFDVACYTLKLWIPAVRFAVLEKSLEKIESKVAEKLSKLGVDTAEHCLRWVSFFPEPVIGNGAIAVPVPTRSDEKRIWKPGRIRLFLSHVSRIKLAASGLKEALAAYGIDAFVAHQDIKPTLEWQREIEFALRSMHMLCALVTEDFTKSLWTDQEVGFALGRGIPVVPISCGAVPYGLLGKHQALSADVNHLNFAAGAVADIVAQQEALRPQLMDGLVDAVCQSISFQHAKDGMRLVSKVAKHLNEAQILGLLEAVRDNSQVRDAHGVPTQIRTIASRRGVKLPVKADVESADFDPDIPF